MRSLNVTDEVVKVPRFLAVARVSPALSITRARAVLVTAIAP